MSDSLSDRILQHVQHNQYRPQKPRRIARELNASDENAYPAFRDALRDLIQAGRIALGPNGTVVPPAAKSSSDEFLGSYRHNRRGFGFVVPTDPAAREDLFIPPGENNGALHGDVVRAKITSRGQRDGRTMYTGRVTEIVERKSKRFAGTLTKVSGAWVVQPDGNTLTAVIATPDAASRHIKPGTKVVVELTTYPDDAGLGAQGVITDVLGKAGEKDVDLKTVIVQYNLPEDFPDAVKQEARNAVDSFVADDERAHRFDLTREMVCTIDPDDAKDYDDAISLRQVADGHWELGVHIADVSYFVQEDSALDLEARERGNSTYFPGYVIPMLPEILSNGVCSLQQGVPRLCKSVFITYDEDARPIHASYANTIIQSAQRLRYREAQAILDHAPIVPHPEGDRKISDYPPAVVKLLHQMDELARRLQQRRRKQGQLVLNLPEIDLVLDDNGRVVDAVAEDTSFTHTLIEMFMVEANEAVARLFNSLEVPFLRRTHPTPELQDSERLRHFVEATGQRLPKELDRHAIQILLDRVKDKPEGFAINLAILKSLTRAEYSPKPIGHYALASEHYGHFTSPIRRYADLTIHRLLDEYFAAAGADLSQGPIDRVRGARKSKLELEDTPTFEDLIELGRHLSFTERRSEDAERELRKVKVLELLATHIGEEFQGVVTGLTNFGLFVQLSDWLIDGLIRYEDLLGEWWDVDERAGQIRGKRTGQKIGIGDVVKALIVRVDVPRRELVLALREVTHRGPARSVSPQPQSRNKKKHHRGKPKPQNRHKKPPRRRR